MAGSKNSQVTAAKVRAVLEAGWAAKIAALNTSYDDGITMVAVDNWYNSPQRSFGGDLNIVIVAGPVDREYQGGERINMHEIVVGIVAGGNTVVSTLEPQEVVVALLWRYWEAVVEILDANNNLTLSGTNWADETLVTSAEPFARALDDQAPNFEQRLAISVGVITTDPD